MCTIVFRTCGISDSLLSKCVTFEIRLDSFISFEMTADLLYKLFLSVDNVFKYHQKSSDSENQACRADSDYRTSHLLGPAAFSKHYDGMAQCQQCLCSKD